jgi:hypothetical protein
VSLAVFWLPTSYTLGFLTSAGIVITYFLSILLFIFRVLMFLIYLLLIWLFSLFGQPPPEAAPPPLPPPLFQPDTPANTPPVPWLEALRSLIFWLVALVIVGYLAKFYLDDHPELRQLLKSFKPVALVLDLWRWLWEKLLRLAKAGVKMIPQKMMSSASQEDTPRVTPRWNWFGLRGLAPRQRILSYYLNILKRTEEYGPARQSHQTPYEYEADLSQAVPQVDDEVDALTQAFVEARYSRQLFETAQANRVKRQWQQIRRALRERRKKRPGVKTPG